MGVRKLILILHRWVGLVAALVLLAVGLSAALLIFERPIHRLLNGSLVKVAPAGSRLSLNEITRRLSQAYPQYHVVFWNLPQQPDDTAAVALEVNQGAKPAAASEEELDLAVNPYTGEVVGNLEKENRLMANVHQFHTRFLAGIPAGRL